MVTNQRCAWAALSTGSIEAGPLNQSRNCDISAGSRSAGGAWIVDPLLADRPRDDLHGA